MIPTSNHNGSATINTSLSLYIFWFLHQTTTAIRWLWYHSKLYIFWFLHQTTTIRWMPVRHSCCISFDSYIKPQRNWYKRLFRKVVYLLIPTSNHNCCLNTIAKVSVVYLLIPTSNHNAWPSWYRDWWLYIFWFLHQTTTAAHFTDTGVCCISFDSYIKPQLVTLNNNIIIVVYLLIPTSNHNTPYDRLSFYPLYIFWFLHQTTTYRFEHTDFQRITNTLSNKKWWVGYNF